ncbi:AraC family transcriptional regulator [Paenibacillus sp. FSL H7-0326]|uniref:helix-turn-helix domain-containing protein n=1 Tax=Paenibacillus sp. FSL H7-0326 TaxID=1921144 RepID=UPI00096FDEA9|nr:helix-turn-helix domain-containing protein [Paenibacillus sp. FSL H7-0326]OMC67240.1 AraC family transcriptional regulator [Paenibacillus sp. FSL H7-0326]
MSRNWYHRLLLSYFPIFLLTVTILIFVSFVFVNDISRMETKKADRIASSYLVDRIDQTLKEIELSVLESVESTEAYKQYFTKSEVDTDDVYAIAKSLRELTSSSPLVQSVYLYDKNNENVLTKTGLEEVNGFSDEAWLRTITAGDLPSGWQRVREYDAGLIQRMPVRVLSINKGLPLPFGSDGVLVVNVKMSGIEQIVDSMVNGQLSFLHIVDREGQVVYRAHSGGEEEESGKVLNSIPLDRLGWYIDSGIKAGNLFGWVSVISYLWVAIALGTVLCAIVYLVYITRRNYKPIQVIMNRIEAHQIRTMDLSESKNDEMKLIDGVLENLIHHMSDYDKKSRENILLQRSKLFSDLLHGEHLDNNMAVRLRELSPFTVIQSSSCFAVVVCEINRYEKFFEERYSRGDQNALKFALINVFQEHARGANLQCWAEWIGHDRSAAIFHAAQENKDLTDTIRYVAEECRSWVEQNLRISLSFGIGPAADGMAKIRDSYIAADSAMQHKLLRNGDITLSGSNESPHQLLETYTYLQMIAEFVKQFRMSSSNWRDQLENIFATFEKHYLPDDHIRSLIKTMLQMLSREVAVMSEQLEEELSGESIENTMKLLEEAETLDTIKSILFEYLTDLFRTYVSVSETKSYRAMVNEMKDYIEEHFTNPDLSLKHLSDRFQISGKYASYLFKTEFNMKFVDFVTELRMKEAEKLLLATDASLQDIALQVGYANAISFGRVFKRLEGITPGDFRRIRRHSSVTET